MTILESQLERVCTAFTRYCHTAAEAKGLNKWHEDTRISPPDCHHQSEEPVCWNNCRLESERTSMFLWSRSAVTCYHCVKLWRNLLLSWSHPSCFCPNGSRCSCLRYFGLSGKKHFIVFHNNNYLRFKMLMCLGSVCTLFWCQHSHWLFSAAPHSLAGFHGIPVSP